MEAFYEELCKLITEEECVLREEPMKNHTTFRVGGPAALYLELKTEQEFGDILQLALRRFDR